MSRRHHTDELEDIEWEPIQSRQANEPSRSRSRRMNSTPDMSSKNRRIREDESGTSDDRQAAGSGKNNKPKSRAGLIIAFVIIIIVSLALLGMLYLQGTLNRIGRVNYTDRLDASQETFDRDAEGDDTLSADAVIFDTDSIAMMQDDDVKNILLIGQDKRSEDTERQRSDTMIICSINTETDKVILTSLMRDMYVEIPGYSANRINSAYVLGGMPLLDEVIETNFGIHIDGNIEVDFDGFLECLTQIGDLEIELNQEEADYININPGLGTTDDGDSAEMEHWNLTAGVNTLTPEQALVYARARYVGNSDYERTERQRKVIMAAFSKIKQSDVATALSLASDILPYLTTDMNNNELLSYVKTVYVDKIDTVESYRIPTSDGYTGEVINGMQVLLPNLNSQSAYLQYYIYGVESDLLNDTYKESGWDTEENDSIAG